MLALALAAAFAASASAAAPPPPERAEEVRIPFVDFGSIRTFRPVGQETVYLQDRRRNWYRATLNGPCLSLPAAIRLGIDNRYSHVLDNTSTFIVDGERCPIHSLVRSGPPPKRRR